MDALLSNIMKGLGEVQQSSEGDIKNMQQTREQIMKYPHRGHLLHYPKVFKNNIIKLEAVELKNNSEDIVTLIIAIHSPGYTQELFDEDIIKTKKYFNIPEESDEKVIKVFLRPIDAQFGILKQVLDSEDGKNQIESVLEKLNSITGKMVITDNNNEKLCKLRIVSAGVASNKFFYQALEYLLNNWKPNMESESLINKAIQFVCNGEPSNCESLRFWKSACINNLVTAVEYINLTNYFPFGYYKDGKGQILNPETSIN